MMGRALLVLWNDAQRAKAIDWIRRAPRDTRVEFKGPQRTLAQNDRLWAMLTDLSEQLSWHGQKLSAEDWKVVMMSGLDQEMRVVANINGDGFVSLGRSSSRLTKSEFGDLMTLIEEFGARHDVKFAEPVDG